MEQQLPLPIVAMRLILILSAVFVTVAAPVLAQVTVDLHALQALPNHPAAGHSSRPAPPSVSPSRPTVAPHEAPVALTATPPATQPQPQPAMPEIVPNTASIAPVTPQAPPAGAQPPPPPAVSAKASTAAAPTTSGLRLTFSPGETDLSPDSSTSIKRLTQTAPPGDTTTFNVLAYAPGKIDDPSTARRISLSRAMVVRSALVADGVPSARIFVRAMGEQYGDGPPDRVDLSVTGTNVSTDAATSR